MNLMDVLFDVLQFDALFGAWEFRLDVNIFLDNHPKNELKIKTTENGFMVVLAEGMEVGLYEFQGTIFIERLHGLARSRGMVTIFRQETARFVYNDVIDHLTRPDQK